MIQFINYCDTINYFAYFRNRSSFSGLEENWLGLAYTSDIKIKIKSINLSSLWSCAIPLSKDAMFKWARPESTGTRHSLGRTHWIICVVVIVILSTRLHVCNKIKDDTITTDIITIIDHFLKPWLYRSWDYDYLDHKHVFRLFGTLLMIFMSLWAPSLNVILTERRWR